MLWDASVAPRELAALDGDNEIEERVSFFVECSPTRPVYRFAAVSPTDPFGVILFRVERGLGRRNPQGKLALLLRRVSIHACPPLTGMV